MADSDLDQVKEIELSSAPSSLEISVYRGLEGQRGAYVIPGLGDPREYDFANSYILDNEGKSQLITPQLFDWFINLKPTDPDYLTTYILNKYNEWDPTFKVIPNTYHTNRVIPFISGASTTNVVVSNQTLLLSQEFGDQSNKDDLEIFRIPDSSDTVASVASEAAMLALASPALKSYAFRSDLSQFYRLVDSPSTDILSWQAELSINVDIDIENPPPGSAYPVMSSFDVGLPQYDGTNYTFPLAISAIQLNSAVPGGIDPISGARIAHISISVI